MVRGSIRPGGRTERVRQKVAETVLQFIKDGKGDFTVQDISERSGIARSTIYARWPNREQLVAEALRAHNSIFQVEPQDDWRAHLQHSAFAFRDFSARPDEIAINVLTAQLSVEHLAEQTYSQWSDISTRIAAPLLEAQRSGSICPEINPILVISTLFTSIAGHIMLAKDVPTDDHLRQLVDLLVSGCEAKPST